MGASPHAVGGHAQAVSASDEALGGQVEGSVRVPHALFRPPQGVGVAHGAGGRSDEGGGGREQAMGPRAQRVGGRGQPRGGCAGDGGVSAFVAVVSRHPLLAETGVRHAAARGAAVARAGRVLAAGVPGVAGNRSALAGVASVAGVNRCRRRAQERAEELVGGPPRRGTEGRGRAGAVRRAAAELTDAQGVALVAGMPALGSGRVDRRALRYGSIAHGS